MPTVRWQHQPSEASVAREFVLCPAVLLRRQSVSQGCDKERRVAAKRSVPLQKNQIVLPLASLEQAAAKNDQWHFTSDDCKQVAVDIGKQIRNLCRVASRLLQKTTAKVVHGHHTANLARPDPA